jgi:2'-5' RNA ligase
MLSYPDEEGRINLFSLVAYIPDPLGSFLDALRKELVPSCNLRAHVTVLPPRPIAVDIESACEQVRSSTRDLAPFEVRGGDVEIFSISSVVYLSVGAGFSKLCHMHESLNVNGLQFNEPYSFHPHITLAQQITPEQTGWLYEVARLRWAECRVERSFLVDHVTFVQGTCVGTWVDLAECAIGTGAHTP